MLTFCLDILIETLFDTLSLFPYLYLAYLLIEYLEQQMSRRSMIYIRKAKKYGSVVGGLLGIVPQCGFSVVAANLYTTGLITLGALFAVFLSTSDEMLPLLLSGGVNFATISKILLIKLFYAILTGLVIDRYLPNTFIKKKNDPDIEAFCKREKCKCDEKENIFKSAFIHSEKILLFVFFFSLAVNVAFGFGGKETIYSAISGMPFLSKVLAAGFGLIPSCAPSVLFTQLYMSDVISLGAMIAGTLSNAGLGFLVLYRVNPNSQENMRILAILFGCGVFFGILTDILF